MSWTVISGTNREGSNTLAISRWIRERMSGHGDTQLVDLRDLPLEVLSPQAYADKPAGLTPMIDAIMGADGLIVVVPEYNGSFPGVMKLFIDMLPFPEAFEHRPVAFVGISAGRWGAIRSVEQLEQVFAYRLAHRFPRRCFIPQVHNALGEDGAPTDPALRERIESQLAGFAAFASSLKGLA